MVTQKYSGGMRWLLYIVSFFGFGWLGLVIGIFLMTRDDAESKQVGKNCLIAWLLSFILGCVCVLCWFFFAGGMAILGGGQTALLLPII